MDAAQHLLFGRLLRRYREAAGLTQEEVAERADLSARGVNFLEHGKRHPHRDTVRRLADALDLSAADRATFTAAARTVPAVAAATRPVSLLLVGRAAELALVERHLAGEGPPLLLLAGEPGIGKSRLLQEAAARAASRGWRVLCGGCQRRAGQEPFAPLLQALQSHVQAQSPARLSADLQGCAWLVRLLPELADAPIDPLPAWTVAPAQERRLLFDAVVRFLANIAGPAGTVLALDDLQWAGADALDLLIALARSAQQAPLRLIGAYRDTEGGTASPLGGALADLAQAGLGSQHRVTPLPPPEATELLRQVLAQPADAEPDDTRPQGEQRRAIDARLRERLLRRTGGVPFFLVSCAQALRQQAATGDDDLPWDVAQGVRQRAAALPAGGREVLGVAAVAGRATPYAVLAAVLPMSEDDLLDALDAACRARLLEETGDEYGFVHDVIREVVEQDLGTVRRTVLHRRIGDALERGHGRPSVELLAYHFARAGVQDKAVRYVEQAGDKAHAEYAYAAAEGYFRDLAERLEGLARPAEAARAREKLGAVLKAVARPSAALEVLERAAQAYRALDDAEAEGRVVAQIGLVHYFGGTPQDGVARLLPVVERLEGRGSTHSLALLYAALPRLFLVLGRHQEQHAAAARAYELAQTLDDERLRAEAETVYGTALLKLGHLDKARAVLERAIPRAEATGDLFTLAAGCLYLSEVCRGQSDFAGFHRYMSRALETAQRRGGMEQMTGLTANLAYSCLLIGDWQQARALAERRLAMAAQHPSTDGYPITQRILATLCLYEGDEEGAQRHLAAYAACAEQNAWPDELRRKVGHLQAERDLLAGQPEAALERLDALLPTLPPAEHVHLLPLVAWAYLELGRTHAAHETARTAVAMATTAQEPLPLLDALRVSALEALRRGARTEAERALEEGLALARRLPYPHGTARLLSTCSQLHLRRGDPEQARTCLAEAVSIFRKLGARPEMARAERDLKALETLASSTRRRAELRAAQRSPGRP